MDLTRRRFLILSSLAIAAQQHRALCQAAGLADGAPQWLFLTSGEAAFVGAVADVLIPADAHSPGATSDFTLR